MPLIRRRPYVLPLYFFWPSRLYLPNGRLAPINQQVYQWLGPGADPGFWNGEGAQAEGVSTKAPHARRRVVLGILAQNSAFWRLF